MEKEEWQTVTGEKKKKKKTEEPTNTTTSFSSPSSLANADDTQKKYGAGSNKAAHNSQSANLIKLDNFTFDEDDATPVESVSRTVSQAIQQARQQKNLTQKELATKINEQHSLVQQYEQGKGVPNQQVLAKLEKVLGVKLRGKNIGSPLT